MCTFQKENIEKDERIKFYESDELKQFLEAAKQDKFPLSYPYLDFWLLLE